MNKKVIWAAFACFSLFALSGCQSRWAEDPQFGVATRNLAAAQYVNPDAPVPGQRMPGLDGPAAAKSVESYQGSFGSSGGSKGSSGSGAGTSAATGAAQSASGIQSLGR